MSSTCTDCALLSGVGPRAINARANRQMSARMAEPVVVNAGPLWFRTPRADASRDAGRAWPDAARGSAMTKGSGKTECSRHVSSRCRQRSGCLRAAAPPPGSASGFGRRSRTKGLPPWRERPRAFHPSPRHGTTTFGGRRETTGVFTEKRDRLHGIISLFEGIHCRKHHRAPRMD